MSWACCYYNQLFEAVSIPGDQYVPFSTCSWQHGITDGSWRFNGEIKCIRNLAWRSESVHTLVPIVNRLIEISESNWRTSSKAEAFATTHCVWPSNHLGISPTFLATLKLHGHQLIANKVQATTHRNASWMTKVNLESLAKANRSKKQISSRQCRPISLETGIKGRYSHVDFSCTFTKANPVPSCSLCFASTFWVLYWVSESVGLSIFKH